MPEQDYITSDEIKLVGELEQEELTKWERDFVITLSERIEAFGLKAYVSPKQKKTLEELKQKYYL